MRERATAVNPPSPNTGGVGTIDQQRVERAIMARYAPLPELTMPLLAAQLNQFRVGELRPAARTWEIMWERDGDLSVPGEKLFSDIARLPWEIEKEDDSKEAEQDFELLQYFYTHLTATSVLDQDETGGINLLLRQLMTAHANRYSIHEMLLRVNNASKREITAEFRHAPVWFFGARRGRLEYLKNDGEINGEPLQPLQWLVGVGRGMMRPCSVAYFTKWGPLADWMFFAKRFGLPAIHGETGAAANTPEWDQFEAALLAFANGWILQTSGIGSHKINLIEAGKGGGSTLPFKDLVERADRVYARCFRGGDLSTQSREGGDVAGANPQEGEKQIFLEDGGQWATDVLNARVDEPLVAYAYNRAPKAWICIRPPEGSNLKQEIDAYGIAVRAGAITPNRDDEEYLRKKHSLPPINKAVEREWKKQGGARAPITIQDEGSAPSTSPFGRNNNVAALGNSETQLASVVASQVNTILSVLERIGQIKDDAQMLAALENFLAQSDRFAALATADVSRVQRALEQITKPALAAGLKGKP